MEIRDSWISGSVLHILWKRRTHDSLRASHTRLPFCFLSTVPVRCTTLHVHLLRSFFFFHLAFLPCLCASEKSLTTLRVDTIGGASN